MKIIASFAIEDFLGDGVLNGLIPKLAASGWDDVPTIKMMNAEDMEYMKLTQKQKDALELRSYLHDRALMDYADRLEASGKSLVELLGLSTTILLSQFRMRKGHAARFIDRTITCRISMPPSYSLSARQRSIASMVSISKSAISENSIAPKSMQMLRTPTRRVTYFEPSFEQSVIDYKIKADYVFKGIVAAEPAEPRLCGCIQPQQMVGDVTSYESIENISVQRLTPQYKFGMERLLTAKAPPMKASDLWHNSPVVLLCVRRPGCIMCRAEAHQLYSRKPIFDSMGVQLIAILHEQIESEVQDFWPRYWGGIVILDQNLDFYKALGGGNLLKDKFLSGFLLNSRAIANYQRAKATGFEHNYRGEGEIKGGLLVVGSGKKGIAYQFIERNFGDWAPIPEVIEVCSRIQNMALDEESFTEIYSTAK